MYNKKALVKNSAKLNAIINKCIQSIGYKNTNDALVRATKNPIYRTGDMSINIIKEVCKEFRINHDDLFSADEKKSVDKYKVQAQKIYLAMVAKYTKTKLSTLSSMFNPHKPISTIWRYVNFISSQQKKIEELNYVANKISDISAKSEYTKRIQEIKYIITKYEKIEKKINKLYNHE